MDNRLRYPSPILKTGVYLLNEVTVDTKDNITHGLSRTSTIANSAQKVLDLQKDPSAALIQQNNVPHGSEIDIDYTKFSDFIKNDFVIRCLLTRTVSTLVEFGVGSVDLRHVTYEKPLNVNEIMRIIGGRKELYYRNIFTVVEDDVMLDKPKIKGDSIHRYNIDLEKELPVIYSILHQKDAYRTIVASIKEKTTKMPLSSSRDISYEDYVLYRADLHKFVFKMDDVGDGYVRASFLDSILDMYGVDKYYVLEALRPTEIVEYADGFTVVTKKASLYYADVESEDAPAYVEIRFRTGNDMLMFMASDIAMLIDPRTYNPMYMGAIVHFNLVTRMLQHKLVMQIMYYFEDYPVERLMIINSNAINMSKHDYLMSSYVRTGTSVTSMTEAIFTPSPVEIIMGLAVTRSFIPGDIFASISMGTRVLERDLRDMPPFLIDVFVLKRMRRNNKKGSKSKKRGNKGPKSGKGSKAPKGSKGNKGTKSTKPAKGAKGAKSNKGVKNPKGNKGPKGAKSTKNPNNPKNPKGPKVGKPQRKPPKVYKGSKPNTLQEDADKQQTRKPPKVYKGGKGKGASKVATTSRVFDGSGDMPAGPAEPTETDRTVPVVSVNPVTPAIPDTPVASTRFNIIPISSTDQQATKKNKGKGAVEE
tara:strand:- start:8976 stop:10907 length:1932 start_codon:yes stop_codon:yes gene_type:complete